ncbi:hypothetical protein [Arthrobacter sp. ZGTC412]|uniref:hypothetical protein n=1 Tax=Arthrobacter sp. ZGTC412 TaxID=2058900 RepID=UPI0015E31953|nr:hypothetical protein [Arthrobacter sp. ZGTC412]
MKNLDPSAKKTAHEDLQELALPETPEVRQRSFEEWVGDPLSALRKPQQFRRTDWP